MRSSHAIRSWEHVFWTNLVGCPKGTNISTVCFTTLPLCEWHTFWSDPSLVWHCVWLHHWYPVEWWVYLRLISFLAGREDAVIEGNVKQSLSLPGQDVSRQGDFLTNKYYITEFGCSWRVERGETGFACEDYNHCIAYYGWLAWMERCLIEKATSSISHAFAWSRHIKWR